MPQKISPEDKFLSSLNDLYASPVLYQCSGKVLGPLTLLAKVGEQALAVDFPVSADNAATDLKSLMDLCEPATFGRGKEHILDPSYRNALVLHTPALGLVGPNFSSTAILDSIQNHLLTPNQQLRGKRIKAVLDKCNVYAKGGFFGPHVDTPRGRGMFASLVLILPTHFTGGELIVRGKAPGTNARSKSKLEEHAFGCDNSTHLKWIAFVSNTEHEIKPVLDGFRVTVTYNLFLEDVDLSVPFGANQDRPTVDSPVYDIFLQGLKDPDFWPEGKEIGIYCQNKYSVGTKTRVDEMVSHLRGIDLWVHNSLKFLSASGMSGITFSMHFVIAPTTKDDEEILVAFPCEYTLESFSNDLLEDGDAVKLFLDNGCRALQGSFDDGSFDYDESTCEEEEVWIVNKWVSNGEVTYMTYGNEPAIEHQYASIMFLINVPAFEVRFSDPE